MKYDTLEELKAKYPDKIVMLTQPSQGARVCRSCWRRLAAWNVTCFRIYDNWEDWNPVKFYQCTSQTDCGVFKIQQERDRQETAALAAAWKEAVAT